MIVTPDEHSGFSLDEKVAIIWSDHFVMKQRIDRLYWALGIVAVISFAAGAATERFSKIFDRLLN